MSRFPSPRYAFAWSYEVLDVWRAGSSFDPDPDHLGGGGTGAMGAVVLALSVEKVADKVDPGILRQNGRIDREKSWFYLIYVDQPEPHYFTPNEQWHLDKAICEFCEGLVEKGLAEKGGCMGKCPARKGGP